MENSKRINTWPILVTFLLMTLAGFLTWFYFKIKLDELDTSLRNKEFQLNSYIDKYDRETIKVASIELDNKDLKLLVLQYRQMYELEKMKPGKVLSIGSEKIVTRDTLYLPTDSIYIVNGKPVYHIKDSTQWHTFDIWAGSDSSRINYSINNSFVSWHQNDAKWYQRDQINFYSINLNPNTRTQDKIQYQAKGSRKYVLAWFAVGLIGGYLAR